MALNANVVRNPVIGLKLRGQGEPIFLDVVADRVIDTEHGETLAHFAGWTDEEVLAHVAAARDLGPADMAGLTVQRQKNGNLMISTAPVYGA